MQAVGYSAYQRAQAEMSSPGEVIVLLYDALLTNLHRSQEALETGDAAVACAALTRAQDITLELQVSLDAGSDLASELLPLYSYLFRRLVEANLKKDPEIVREVERLITPIREAWAFAASGARPGVATLEGEAVHDA